VIRPKAKWDGVRRWSLGVHGAVMGFNQVAGNERVVLGGAGFQLRLRSKGRFGFEAAQSFLHGSFLDGALVRDSFPFTTSLMFYIFKNEDTRHFNIYGLAGIGIQPSQVQVRFAQAQFVPVGRGGVTRGEDIREQDFMEFEGHIAIGAELRFKWFAIDGEVRGVGLVRDNTDAPATFYDGVSGEAIPPTSLAIQGRLNLSVWF